ncbi:MAG: 50S ribosomal protein L9 [Lachnospiraceae bacterium]|nr:50S ribosomal protein L9 [Lachnospiraceae bacterium]
MEVILLQDVKSLGKKGDKVNVNDGYARNYIIPKKLGIQATAANINDLKLQKANEARIEQKKLEEARELAAKLEQSGIRLAVKCGENGKTFGSISSKEIAAAVSSQTGLEIDKKKVLLKDQIKTVGTYTIPVKVHRDVTAQLKLEVEAE